MSAVDPTTPRRSWLARLWNFIVELWDVLRRPSSVFGLGLLVFAGFVAGIIFWGGFNTALEVTNTEKFCTGCHEMRDNVFAEMKPTVHFTNASGVRASCPDCHVPHNWTDKIARKMQASKEVWGHLFGTIDTREKFRDYVTAGYEMHLTSVKKQIGLEALHDALAGRTSVLSGPSGVGKSSLLNGMYPGLNLRVGEISESVNKGRHTTVGALLHPLPDSGYVVDTPGLREVGMWGMPSDHLDACFPELRDLISDCRFADCTHRTEPGCAVLEGVQSGRVSRDRYDSYVKLREELEDTERKWATFKPGAYDRKKRGR